MITARQSIGAKSMDTGQIVKEIPQGNLTQPQGKRFNSASTFFRIIEWLIKAFAFQYLQKYYVLIRSFCIKCISLYITWAFGNRPLERENGH